MKTVFVLIALASLLSSPTRLHAIECGSDPTDSTAQYVGSYVAYANLDSEYTEPDFNLENASCKAGAEICVWESSLGQIELLMNVNSIMLSGECTESDGISTVTLFNKLAYAAIKKGLSVGDIHCLAPCIAPSTIIVKQASCVQRIGSGFATTFVACDTTTFCQRDFTLCCDGTGTTITPVTFIQNPVCSGYVSGCEATCQ